MSYNFGFQESGGIMDVIFSDRQQLQEKCVEISSITLSGGFNGEAL